MKKTHSLDPQDLRRTDLMIAYLNDRVSLDEAIEIETLMEQDELYRLAMEQLSQSLATHPTDAFAHVEQVESHFPAYLMEARTQFVTDLDAGTPPGDPRSFFSKLELWKKLTLVGLGLLTLAAAIVIFSKNPAQETSQLTPTKYLSPSKDIQLAEQFLSECNEIQEGFGRKEEISVFSALVEHYSEGAYTQAARQLRELRSAASVSANCRDMNMFFEANCHLAQQDYRKANTLFESLLTHTQLSPQLRNASHWYLAQIALTQQDIDQANEHFQWLVQQQGTRESDHLPELNKLGYLGIAQTYLDEPIQ